jgi:ferredoxin--NADP+ reductase
MAKPVEYNAILLDRIDLTEKLAIFRVKPDPTWGPAGDGQIPEFEGGQYAVLGLTNERDPDKGAVLRPYSISSPPEEKRFLEFYIRYVDKPASESPLTHLLWKLKPGDRLHLGRRITGHFTLAKTVGPDDPRLKVFVAAGTGLAPFVSIVLSYLRRGASPGQFAILHGARLPEELGYREDLQRIFRELPSRYLPTVTDRSICSGENPCWAGDIGRVETFFDDEKLSLVEARLGLEEGELTPQRAVVYICGLYGTIHNTLVRLLARGFVPNDRAIRQGLGLHDEPASLFFEKYDDVPILDVSNKAEMEKLLAETPFASRLKPEEAAAVEDVVPDIVDENI